MEPKQDMAPTPTPGRAIPPKPPVQNPVASKPAPVPTTTPKPVVAPEPEPKPEVKPAPKPEEPNIMAVGAPKKKSKGMVYGMILLAIIAIAGIGFGVWTMLDSNTQKEQLNSQITTLKAQNNELQDKLAEAETEPEEETEEIEEEQETVSLWPATMGEIGYKFYVINDAGEIVTSDSTVEVKDVLSCDIPAGPQTVKEIQCGITTTEDEEGVYFYDGETGALKFYTADEWKTYLDSKK